MDGKRGDREGYVSEAVFLAQGATVERAKEFDVWVQRMGENIDRGSHSQRSRMPERSDEAPGGIYHSYRAADEPTRLIVFRYYQRLVTRIDGDVSRRVRNRQ